MIFAFFVAGESDALWTDNAPASLNWHKWFEEQGSDVVGYAKACSTAIMMPIAFMRGSESVSEIVF